MIGKAISSFHKSFTMKSIQFFILTLALAVTSCNEQSGGQQQASNEAPTLENRVFAIDNYANDKKDSSEDLIFKNQLLEGSECGQWGFVPSAYTTENMADGSIKFGSVMSSPNEGTMVWEGSVKNKSIEGKIVWSKTGQADVNIVFSGMEK